MHPHEFEQEYVHELRQVRADTALLIPAAEEFARAADNAELRDVVRNHVKELSSQADRLAEIGAADDAYADEAVAALIAKAARVVATYSIGPGRDIALIAAIQHIQHYQIASLGTLAAYAKLLGRHDEKRILGAMLEDQKAFDEDLTVIAATILEALEAPVAA